MHRGDEGQPGLPTEQVEELQRLLLMPDVERGGGLVEEDDLRFLRERAGDHHTLFLAARERPEPALAVPHEVEPGERSGGRLPVVPALLGERAEVRRAAEQHVLAHRHPRRGRGLLRNHRQETRELPPRQLHRLATSDPDRAREGNEAGDRSQERRLPGAVRPDERQPLPVRDGSVDAVDDGPPAERDGDLA